MAGKIHDQHRARMREKAEKVGLENLPEHEQLEMLLYAVVPRENTNETAHLLLKRFGSIYGVLTADLESLREVPKVGTRTADFLHQMLSYLGIAERSKMLYFADQSLVMDTTEKMGHYLKSLFLGCMIEKFYLVSLSSSKRVIAFDLIAEGTVDEAPVYLSNIASCAIQRKASFVILAHNHPGGNPNPSAADLEETRRIAEALSIFPIKVLDHMILAGNDWCSVRKLGIAF